MDKNLKESAPIYIALFIAVNLTGIAVAFIITANLGSDTITVFVDGLHRTANISLGTASRVYNIFTLAIALIIARKNIGWTTILYALTVGFSMDFYTRLLDSYSIADYSFIIRILCVFLGQICMCVVYALIIKYRKGMNQVDAITYYICDKTNVSYIIIRTVMDVILLAAGWIMGGVVGIGSVFTMFTTGIFVNTALRMMKYNDVNN